ncbi:MAG TPA: hypothetical protein VHB25_07920 [Gemmatimonadaceae bacterium]|nr:hypothetical protein [Gemmatimonadaceae bacterium]
MAQSISIDRADGASGPSIAPYLSVIVTWPHRADRLADTLVRQLHARRLVGADTIVVSAEPIDEATASAFPEIRFITAPADYSPARMRTLGLKHASGDVVMLIDDLADETEVEA